MLFPRESTTSVIVLSLGQLTLKTVEQTERRDVAALYAAGLTAEQVLDEVRSQAYDKFQLNIQNVQVLVAVAGENWQACLSHDRVTQMHIVEPIGLHVTFDMCVVDDDPQLPKMRICIKVPRIGISIADDRTLCALALVLSIPLPESSDRIDPRMLSKEKSVFMASSMSQRRFLGDGGVAHRSVKAQTQDAFKSVPMSDPSADIVQFTDLELSFVMNELCVNLYRVSEVSDMSPATQSYRTPPEEFVLASDNTDHLPSTTHPRPSLASVDLSGGRHLSMRVRQLELSMVQRTYDLKVALKLGAIGLNQIRPDDIMLSDLAIIETPTYADCTGYLFTCNYMAVSKTVPEFATRYKSIEQLVEINFSVLIMRLHQERITELMKLAYDLQLSYEQIAQQTANALPFNDTVEIVVETVNVAQQRDRVAFAGDQPLNAVGKAVVAMRQRHQLEAAAVNARNAYRSNRNTVVDSIQLKVVANMERVSIVLECYRKRIAELKVEKLCAGFIVKKSYTDVSLRLQDIVITDLNSRSIHPTILSVIGGNALACQVVMYDMNETANYNMDNLRIDVSMGCAKIVFLNCFASSVLQFMDNFQVAQRAIADAGTAAAEQAKQNMVLAYENAQRMRLNIHIKAPIILVPMDSQSRDAIAIDFGNLAITNVCSEIASSQLDHGPAILDETKLELKDLKLSRVYIEEDALKSHTTSSSSAENTRMAGLRTSVDILSPTTFATLIRRNLSAGWYRQIPDLDISARLKRIEVGCLLFNI